VARTLLVAAGGTGGHLFPAEALALAMKARGWRIHLATDHRVEKYGKDFPAEETHVIESATITKEPVAAAKAALTIGRGLLRARFMIGRIKPSVAIGFGGYPTVPTMFAAVWAKVPTIVHEQNAVLGRANKLLAPRVTRIASSFATVGGAEAFASRIHQTGNPVRPAVVEAAATPYPPRNAGDPLHLLVFGGSQGARVFADLLPAAVALLPEDARARLRIVQQCRPEDLGRVHQGYELLGVEADLGPFFVDMPARIAAAQLVVCRSGASSCAELAVVGRPSILVPLPHALDQDQRANAEVLARAGGAWLINQSELSPARLADELTSALANPGKLAAAAEAAQTQGRPDAAERLADLVENMAVGRP
jgi:UDP-N-acetylglucosamine--N-acetylmuramyl-(pentapeptide) pyrophosphoryl-undecaprenol N-acetylglucosamine transferase